MINNYYPGTPARNFMETGFNETFAAVLRRVYVWMTLGLLVTAGTAAFVSVSPLFQLLAGQPLIFLVLMIAELGLVVGLSWGINRLAPATAMLLFFLYAILNGLTFSVLFVVYTLGSVASTFVATAALFGVMSILGYTTKLDLSRVGSFLFMGLIGLLIAMLVNMFWTNTILGWIITFAGILIFLGLTFYDTQRIKRMTATALQQGDENVQARMGILGALSLYLDFINLFLFILRLGGRRR
ncbi:MAG TPA: Bax inhibitor-1/YccA family protein [Anaerolineales bacterium]|nr:Bax inhibitor-1/YccA family protein [Anaerolineales bacterium]